jgi:hypothetical protein
LFNESKLTQVRTTSSWRDIVTYLDIRWLIPRSVENRLIYKETFDTIESKVKILEIKWRNGEYTLRQLDLETHVVAWK